MGSLLRAQAKGTEQNMGNQRRRKTLHSKTHHEHENGNVCNFLYKSGPAIPIAVPKGKSGFYKGKVLHKLKKYFLNRRPATCLHGVRLLHNNASSHKAVIVREYLKQEKVVELPHPPYSLDLAPCDFFLFRRLKKHLAGRKYQTRKKSRFGYYSVSEQYTSKRL